MLSHLTDEESKAQRVNTTQIVSQDLTLEVSSCKACVLNTVLNPSHTSESPMELVDYTDTRTPPQASRITAGCFIGSSDL